ncbi:MAG: hypothetical protein ACYDIA_01720 [Candidatus Humimicrobiaceae bacterium]
MRKSIIVELKEITDFGDRVYQAFLAPVGVVKPYCVVKMGEESPVPNNKKGSQQHFEVYIYITPSSYITLDGLVLKVKQKLDKVTLSTDESPARFFTPEFERVLADYKDDVSVLLMKAIYFNYALARH